MKKKALTTAITTKNNQRPPKPKDNSLRKRSFLNENNPGGIAAILVDFSLDSYYSDKDKKWKSWNQGSVQISDCRKTINLDFDSTRKQALKKLDKMISILSECREFVKTNFGDK